MKKYCKYILPAVFAFILVVSCKKKDYLTDSGVHNAVTPLTNYDYLKQNNWRLFDTLLMIIDKFNLKEDMNETKTFFAPTNYSINAFITARLNDRLATSSSATYTLDTLYKYITADSIRQYMFNDRITLDDIGEDETKLFTNRSKTNMGVFKELQRANQFTMYTNNPTYLLYLVKIRGSLDVPGVIPPTGEEDIRVRCQTTGIETSNGATILHVLNNQHQFIRF
jgi:hypothetical protein